MEFWEKDFQILHQLSRKQSHRFGTSFLLEHTETKEKVVLKTVSIDQPLGFQQLKNEAQFHFDFPGLPTILQTETTESSFSILKKFEEGKTLSEFWSKVKRRNRLSTLKQLIAALQPILKELEIKEITHGDLKPDNIIVSEKDGILSCALIDFGLAFQRQQLPERDTIFQLAYAPPELILNRLDCADASTDIFSFCLIIYKLWTGKLPFQASNPALLTQLQITYPVEKPWRMPKKMWLILEKGLQKHSFSKPPNQTKLTETIHALRKNNTARYANFDQFAQAFFTL